jgi:hypothetical protein
MTTIEYFRRLFCHAKYYYKIIFETEMKAMMTNTLREIIRDPIKCGTKKGCAKIV